ncbi:MAG: peptidylprolyl isomerase [Terracidiphilus sp.]
MILRPYRISAAFLSSTLLLAASALAPLPCAAQQTPYGGTTVEQIIARVNDQIITNTDYDRAMKDLDDEERQRGATMQEMYTARKNLLRNLIDQQLWLSKGKELGITGETELINRLNEIRKQYHMASMEDLEKAAKEQGISFEDFKAHIRDQIITQDVMRQEVGEKIEFTPGDARRYYEKHKQEYARQESVTLAEILVSTGPQVPSATIPGEVEPVDPATLAKAKAKADELEAKLLAGGNFAQLARTFSDGPTAAEGGDLGEFHRGDLAKVLEEKTFPLKAGQWTEPIRTRQGFIILEVEKHTPGGIPPFKDVEQQVEDAYYMSKMEPAIRAYLTKMREEAFIDIKPGYVDTGASPNETKPIYSAYTPPAPKKKRRVERTRFREISRRDQHRLTRGRHGENTEEAQTKPGKREKIRYGQAPTETLPNGPEGAVENGGAMPQEASLDQEPANPLETAPQPKKKIRYRDVVRPHKSRKHKKQKTELTVASEPDAAEIAAMETQNAPLGLGGDTANIKKKKTTTNGVKTRFSDRRTEKKPEEKPEKKTAQPEDNSGDVHGWW